MATGVLEELLAAVTDLNRKIDRLSAAGLPGQKASTVESNDTRPPEWLTVQETAAHSRGGRGEVLAALADGSLRGYQVKPGGKWRIHRDDVDAWLRGEQPAAVDAHFTRRKL